MALRKKKEKEAVEEKVTQAGSFRMLTFNFFYHNQ